MKTILAILFLTFNFSSYADFYITACSKPLQDMPYTEERTFCETRRSGGANHHFNWNSRIKVNSVEEVDAKIETVKTTLVESINNLGSELKTGIVIELIKSDPEFRKIIEDIVESKIKKKSTGEETAE